MKPKTETIIDIQHNVLRIRDVFKRADYTSTRISELFGGKVSLASNPAELSQIYPINDTGSSLETLVRLFLLNLETDLEPVQRATHPMDLNTWINCGLLQVRGRTVFPLIRILPIPGLLLASDIYRGNENREAVDFVMGLSGSTFALSNATLRRKVDSVLDVGCGSGIQSLLAANHGGRVLGVDLNPRAVMFAKLNAQLNDIKNVEFIEGNLFGPVAGRKFDLIVANPPFVISPDFQSLYLNNGEEVDAFCQKIIQNCSRYMNEGGVFQMTFNWAHVMGQRWQDRLAQWCTKSNCDAWVMRKETSDPSEYFRVWNRGKVNTAGYLDTYNTWMSWYEQNRIEAVSFGIITMRRKSRRSNWFRADDAPEVTVGPIGDDIFRIFESSDWLHANGNDASLMQARFTLDRNVRLDQVLKPASNGWCLDAGHLRRTTGLVYTGNIDPETAGLLCRLDGTKTLRELLEFFAAKRKTEVSEIAPEILKVVRRLLNRGFLNSPTRIKIPAISPGAMDAAIYDAEPAGAN